MGNEQNTPDLSQMLSKVMSNPQAMAMFSSLLGGQMKVQNDTNREEWRECDCEVRERDDGCSRREACQRRDDGCPRCEPHQRRDEGCLTCQRQDDTDIHDTCMPPANHSCTQENRRRLLMALRPYLSPERCQALDRILMIAEALTLLQSEKRK